MLMEISLFPPPYKACFEAGFLLHYRNRELIVDCYLISKTCQSIIKILKLALREVFSIA